MKIVVKKVPKFLRGFVKLIFGIKDEKYSTYGITQKTRLLKILFNSFSNLVYNV